MLFRDTRFDNTSLESLQAPSPQLRGRQILHLAIHHSTHNLHHLGEILKPHLHRYKEPEGITLVLELPHKQQDRDPLGSALGFASLLSPSSLEFTQQQDELARLADQNGLTDETLDKMKRAIQSTAEHTNCPLTVKIIDGRNPEINEFETLKAEYGPAYQKFLYQDIDDFPTGAELQHAFKKHLMGNLLSYVIYTKARHKSMTQDLHEHFEELPENHLLVLVTGSAHMELSRGNAFTHTSRTPYLFESESIEFLPHDYSQIYYPSLPYRKSFKMVPKNTFTKTDLAEVFIADRFESVLFSSYTQVQWAQQHPLFSNAFELCAMVGTFVASLPVQDKLDLYESSFKNLSQFRGKGLQVQTVLYNNVLDPYINALFGESGNSPEEWERKMPEFLTRFARHVGCHI